MGNWQGESREFAKINFDFLLMTHIQDINKQLSKLPHESVLPNYSEPVGTTYIDIITSYCNMVEHLEALLKPYHDDIYRGIEFDDKIELNTAKNKFGRLMELCDRKGFLFVKIRTKVSGEDSE